MEIKIGDVSARSKAVRTRTDVKHAEANDSFASFARLMDRRDVRARADGIDRTRGPVVEAHDLPLAGPHARLERSRPSYSLGDVGHAFCCGPFGARLIFRSGRMLCSFTVECVYDGDDNFFDCAAPRVGQGIPGTRCVSSTIT
jgi:hypothetical protein